MGTIVLIKLLSQILKLLPFLEHAWALMNDLETGAGLRLRMNPKKCPSCERWAFSVFIQY